MPNVFDLADEFRASLIAAEDDLINFMIVRWLEVENAIFDRLFALADEVNRLEAAGEDVPISKLVELVQYQQLIVQVADEMGRYVEEIAPLLNDAQMALIELGADHARQLVLEASAGRFGVSLFRMNPAAVENLLALARSGQPLEELLRNAYPTTVDQIIKVLLEAQALGLNPRQTARLMMNQGLGAGLEHLLMIARDQQIRAYRYASLQAYRNSDVVGGYRRHAFQDGRTCMACIALDGKVYQLSELMELHPVDRCTMIPLVKGVRPVEWQSAQDWFMGLDAAQQQRMMGSRKWEAWQRGEFSLTDLASSHDNPVWGPSLRVTPLKDLTGP